MGKQTSFTVQTHVSPQAGIDDPVLQTLGDMATQSSDAVAITGGTIAGTDVTGSTRAPVVETLTAAGAMDVTKDVSELDDTAAGMAVTLGVPTRPGITKVITKTAGAHTATLALTNVVGGTASSTATFTNVGDTLIVVAAVSKWVVVKQQGVVLT